MVNIATIIHSDEALLAVAFIFTVHFFNTHFRPDKFPMDPVIFTGRVSVEELKADKPREYDELLGVGGVGEQPLRPVPSERSDPLQGYWLHGSVHRVDPDWSHYILDALRISLSRFRKGPVRDAGRPGISRFFIALNERNHVSKGFGSLTRGAMIVVLIGILPLIGCGGNEEDALSGRGNTGRSPIP